MNQKQSIRYRIVKEFFQVPHFVVEDIVADFPHRPGKSTELYLPTVLWDQVATAYGFTDSEKGWQEQVLNLINPQALEIPGNQELRCNWITSYDLRMSLKEGSVVDASIIFPLAAMGVVSTRDNYIIVGIRGTPAGERITPQRIDQFGSCLFGCPPGGSVTFKQTYDVDPITDTITEEFKEEIGGFDILNQKLLGVFEAFKPGPVGYKFVSTLKTDAKLWQIQEVNRQARELYWGLLGKGATSKEAKKELKREGLPPDAWEHNGIIGFPNRRETLEKIVSIAPEIFPGIGAGGLIVYAKSVFI